MLGLAAVHQLADRLADDVLDAGMTAGADGDELLFLGLNGTADGRCQPERYDEWSICSH
jgi:hypothetical protein